MDNRVNGAGFTEAQVVQQGTTSSTSRCPGQSAQQVVKLVSQTAELLFRQVLLVAPNAASAATAPASPDPVAASPASAQLSPASATTKAGQARRVRPGAARSAGQRRRRRRPAASAPPHSSSPAPRAVAVRRRPRQHHVHLAAGPAATPRWSAPPVKALFDKLNCANKDWQQGRSATPRAVRDNPKIQIVSCGLSAGPAMYKFVLDQAMVARQPGRLGQRRPRRPTSNVLAGQHQLQRRRARRRSATSPPRCTTSTAERLAAGLTWRWCWTARGVSFPTINQGPIVGGSAQIIGNFSQADATNLANQLSYGALPLTFRQESVAVDLARSWAGTSSPLA